MSFILYYVSLDQVKEEKIHGAHGSRDGAEKYTV
jgi:hypothetical protein